MLEKSDIGNTNFNGGTNDPETGVVMLVLISLCENDIKCHA